MKLPRLRIEAIHEQSLSITFEESDLIEEDETICLMHSKEKFICGQLVSVDRERKTARLVFESKDDASYLQLGTEYDYLGEFWGARAGTIFDSSRVWARTDFKSVDAVEYIHEGERVRAKVGQEPPPGAQCVHQVEGAWDHEHCLICAEGISEYEGDQKTGYRSQDDLWVCEHCYESYLVPKSLQFIEDLMVSDEPDPESPQ